MFLSRRSLLRYSPLRRCRRSYTPAHGSERLGENDSVVLKPGRGWGATAPVFIEHLKSGLSSDVVKGKIHHDDVVGHDFGDSVYSRPRPNSRKSPQEYILHKATLDQYITSSRRIVTPIYPQDARLIVELLDLHPDTFGSEPSTDEDKIEILEAGTGHGALTLYISRAIHAANPPFHPNAFGENDVTTWKSDRRAILHSVEVVEKHSKHAQNIVHGFRHGLYGRNVDFHVDDVSDWCRKRIAERPDRSSFLSRVFLDLPGSENHLLTVADALRVDGTLVVFNPNIIQILDCFRKVKEERAPLWLEKVIELGNNGGSGGREWDVRAVVPRAEQRADTESVITTDSDVGSDLSPGEDPIDGAIPLQRGTDRTGNDRDWKKLKMVCRPKVGGMVVGGGFLAVFRKRQPRETKDDQLHTTEQVVRQTKEDLAT